MPDMKQQHVETGLEIAVIGMAGKFPRARNIDEFWNNLKDGVEALEFLSNDELREAGVEEGVLNNPNYVKASAALEEKEYFDASFFGYSPQEAELMDPQMRLLHECSWEALEDAGYDPGTYPGFIGFYAGSANSFLWEALAVVSGKSSVLGGFASDLLTQNGLISTRISHKLDLQGPSLSIFTTCSTSLVAIHLACRALLTGECDMALAGGAAIGTARRTGYIYQEGMVFSPDGHCRAFDARAKGAIFGEGVGIVVLKRFKEAAAHRDNIYAVVKGSTINNDGMAKVSFTAPGKRGQQAVIRSALNIARVVPESISFVETHGTGTALGDPIEIEALKDAFKTDKKGYCAVGSVKANIGHLDTAAGVASFIKAVLALAHRLIPPSLNFETPNPNIDFDNSPFYVNTSLSPWKNEKYPLRASVSSFGIGGTNAHVILEEAPEVETSSEGREWKILLFSAKTESLLQRMTESFTAFLKRNPGINLADAAYTLQVGRKAFQYRSMLIASSIDDARDALSHPGSRRVKTCFSPYDDRNLVFMFSGLGGQYVNMGLELYRKEPVFRDDMDRCFDILKSLVDYDIKEVLYPGLHPPAADIDQPEIVQPVVFIFEYALAKLLMKCRITPSAMIGYSFGEYAAAAVSGVFSLEEALKLIVLRGQLIQKLSPGAMLSIPLSSEELAPFLTDEIDLCVAIDNGPSCVVAGPEEAVAAFERRMKDERLLCMRLQASRAIHSKMMEPILEEFKTAVEQFTLEEPQIPFISNVTGSFITAGEAKDPAYWANHLRNTVRFAAGIRELVKENDLIFIEIGPGHDLSSLVVRHLEDGDGHRVLNLIPPPQKDIPDMNYLLNKIGQLWLYGKNIDWAAFYSEETRRRISLPSYPFQRQRYIIEGDPFSLGARIMNERNQLSPKPDIADWFYIPSWKRSRAANRVEWKGLVGTKWLMFVDQLDWGLKLVKELERKEQDVIVAKVGTAFAKINNREYTIDPGNDNDYRTLLEELNKEGNLPDIIVHLWGITGASDIGLEHLDKVQNLGFHSLLGIARAVGKLDISNEIRVMVVTDNMQEIVGEDKLYPEKAVVLGAVKGIPKEYANIKLRSIDVVLPGPGCGWEERLVEQLLCEFITESIEPVIAFRDNHRWVEIYEPRRIEKPEGKKSRLDKEGVYLITGGLGGIGLVLAEFLARRVSPKLVLIGRSDFPPRDQWKHWLARHNEEDKVSCKIRKVQELERMGANVSIFSADVTNREQMEDLIRQTTKEFGQINGVIHAAGVPDGAMIQLRTRETSEKIFAAKVKGTLLLDRVLKDVKLDFFVICSSLDSIITSAGQVGYCGANAFINAFANYKVYTGGSFTVSINWPRWQNLGIAIIAENLYKELRGEDLTGGLATEDGVEAFSRILECSLPQVAVIDRDLRVLLERDYRSTTGSFLEEFETVKTSEDTAYQRPQLTTEYVAPGNELEKKIAKIWQTIFGISQIGVRDDFFELGGDSLKAIIVISKIHKELNVEVPISGFFSAPTIERLAGYINEIEKSDYLAIESAEQREYYVLSSAQRRFYILQQMDIQSVAYNITMINTAEGQLDRERLEKDFQKLIDRHENLRTSFPLVDGEAVQKVHEQVDFSIAYVECSESEAKKIAANFVESFDLTKPPLLRIGLIKLGEQKHILMMDMHHIISDGQSLVLFIQDLLVSYLGKELPLLKLQYKDFSKWQHDMLISGKLEKQEQYWLKVFSGELPRLGMPTDYPRSSIQSFAGDTLQFRFDRELMTRLNRLMRETGATLYMVLLAAYSILLSKYSGQTDIIIGSPAAGRNHLDLENIIGLLMETIAIRSYPEDNKTFEEFLEEVKESTLNVYENQAYPFGELLRNVADENDRSRNPLFDVMLIVQNVITPHEKLGIEDLKFFPYKGDSIRVSKVDITLEAMEIEDGVHFVVEYCTKLFKKETMERLITFFKEILSIVVDNRKIKLKDIKMSHVVSAAEADVFEDDGTDFGF